MRTLLIVLLVCEIGRADSTIQAVVNAGSLTTDLAPGTLAILEGTSLVSGPAAVAEGAPWPTMLNGVSVTVGGVPAPLKAVSDSQISFVIPFEAATVNAGQSVASHVVVKLPDGTTLELAIALQHSAPAILTQDGTPTGTALLFATDGSIGTQIGTDPIVLLATGLGPVDPPGSSAAGGSADEPFNRLVDSITVLVGDMPGAVQVVRLAPGLPGVYEIVVLPQGPISNRVYVVTQKRSNVAKLPIPVGMNVANVKGTIDGVYPVSGLSACVSDDSGLACMVASGLFFSSTTDPQDISEMVFGGSWTASFDVLPGAAPFHVIARCNGLSQVVTVDPVSGTWSMRTPVPKASARAYDFRELGHPVVDFLTGAPFPGNIVPGSRVHGLQYRLTASLPYPNSSDRIGDNVVWQASGPLDDPSHVEWRGYHPSNPGVFGGYVSITQPASHMSTAVFELFIDGLLVASQEIPFRVL